MDYIMVFAAVIFCFMFAFLLFLFGVFLTAWFIRIRYEPYSPDVTIVVPAYNEEKNIGMCLDSLIAASYEGKKELLVVDDGSTDNTIAIAESKGARVLKQNHLGKVEALNLGVISASNEFVITVDADTLVEKKFIEEIIKPMQDPNIAAVSGAARVKNTNSFLTMFQNVEYHNSNILCSSFSKVFKTGIWFIGALACYRKSVLVEAGLFQKDTLAEDIDIILTLKNKGYKTLNTPLAVGYTIAPTTVRGLIKQRTRWWLGILQALHKNRRMKKDATTYFLFINYYWWTLYAFISFPIIIYQVNYWLPQGTLMEVFWYLFRWFSFAGPVYVLYKIPEWGLSFLNIFGVLSGVISISIILSAIILYKDRYVLKNLFAIFFFFPYTILLNIIICLSVLTAKSKPKHFIK